MTENAALQPRILFSNPPWLQTEEVEGVKRLRMGIRAGSRWPFTRHAVHIPDDFKFGGYLPFTFFLGFAAAYTQKEFPEAQVVIRDSIARGESYRTFFDYCAEFSPDWIVIETATPSWKHDQEVISSLAHLLPKARIILTGTLGKEKAKEICTEHRNVWAIVEGEYDKRIASAIRQYTMLAEVRTPVPPVVLHHDLLTVAEMNAAPFPMFDWECANHYADFCPTGQLFPQLQIFTSRGCPYRCCFCVWPAVMTGNDPDGTGKRSVRCYSPEYVEGMIESLLAGGMARGIHFKSIYIDDDTFNLTDKHALAISAVMKRTGLPWSAMCRADTIKRSTWNIMKESGCFGVKIGFESGSQRVVDEIVNKKLNLVEALSTAVFLRSELGMSVHGTFTIGLPGETPEEVEETRAFIRHAYEIGAIDTHQLSGTAEIEGTPLATLRVRGELAKYPGARADAGYHVNPDGQRKVEGMR